MNILHDFVDVPEYLTEAEKLVNIVGLGGESGDFLIDLSAAYFKKVQNINSFCILPFHF